MAELAAKDTMIADALKEEDRFYMDTERYFRYMQSQLDKFMLGRNEEYLRSEGREEGVVIGEQIGILKGEQIGMLKGERIGIVKGMRQTALRLLAMEMDIPSVCEATGLSADEVSRLASENPQL